MLWAKYAHVAVSIHSFSLCSVCSRLFFRSTPLRNVYFNLSEFFGIVRLLCFWVNKANMASKLKVTRLGLLYANTWLRRKATWFLTIDHNDCLLNCQSDYSTGYQIQNHSTVFLESCKLTLHFRSIGNNVNRMEWRQFILIKAAIHITPWSLVPSSLIHRR